MMSAGLRVAVILLLACGGAAADIVRVYDLSPAQLAEVRQHYDFWGVAWREDYAVFRVSPKQRERLESTGLRVETDSVREAELERFSSLAESTRLGTGAETIAGFECYRTVTRTHADLEALADAHPARAEWVDIGDTWQAGAGAEPGDSVFALVLANSQSPHPKAPIVIMAAQHARELATAEIAARFAELLVENPGGDPDIDWLLDHREIHIVAQHNPDGRRQVEQGETLWRKNNNQSACPEGDLDTTWPGIDLNRNSSFLWGESSSDIECSQTYRGPAVASEPETQAIQGYLEQVFARQRPATDLTSPAPNDAEGVFVSIHSFGELILFPWEGLGPGDENHAPNHDALAFFGRRMGFETGYAVGRELLGPAGGTAVDYAYGEFGVAAYTFEVGTSFTQSCESFESTVWPDNRNALLLAVKAARRPYLSPSGPAITALDLGHENGTVVLSGTADDTRYFRGEVAESPANDPIADIVEIRVSIDLPQSQANRTVVFPVSSPEIVVDFDLELPDDITLADNERLFVTAVDAGGRTGLPRVSRLDELIFASGFEHDDR